jgi:prevent-host-death family protein
MRGKEGAAPAASVLDEQSNVTIIGLVKTMTISYFKAHISEELRKVRKGAQLLISDRETPIAVVVPYRPKAEPVGIRAPRTVPFAVPKSGIRISHDPLEYLAEDRGAR